MATTMDFTANTRDVSPTTAGYGLSAAFTTVFNTVLAGVTFGAAALGAGGLAVWFFLV